MPLEFLNLMTMFSIYDPMSMEQFLEMKCIPTTSSFHFDGETYIDTNVELDANEIQTVCLDINPEFINQKANLLSLSSKDCGFR